MIRFRGTFQHVIDSKGRLSVPTRFRVELGDKVTGEKEPGEKEPIKLVVTKGTSACLAVYPWTRWQDLEEDVDNLPAGQEKDDFVRHFVSPAQDVDMDTMGRILIPASLRNEAGLGKEVTVVGAVGKFEIWDRERFDRYMEVSRDQALEVLKNHKLRF